MAVQTKQLELTEVTDGRTVLKLAKPLKVAVSHRCGYYSAANADLNLIATQRTEKEALADLQGEFIFVHQEYGCADDSRLTKGAQDLKRRVLSYVCAKL